MMGLRLKSIDLKGAVAKGRAAERRIVSMLTIAVREDTKPYVPYVTGALRSSAEVASVPDAGKLIYDTPYARAQYYGLPNKTWPGTKMQWFEESLAANKAKWERMANEEARRV